MNRVDKLMAQAAAGRAEDVHVRVDYSLPKNSMVVSPDVFSRMKELSDLEQKEEFYADSLGWLRE